MPIDPAGFIKSVFFVFGTLVPIINPFGGAPIFLAATEGAPDTVRRRLANAVGRYSFILLVASLVTGAHVLQFFGISLPIVRIGGGLLVAATGWKMLEYDDSAGGMKAQVAQSGIASTDSMWETKAFFPLTFPLTCGPGSISVAITLGASTPTHGLRWIESTTAAIIGAALTALLVAFTYRFAAPLLTRLGRTGTAVLMRLSAFILLCIGVQIVWGGVEALLASRM